MAQEKVTIMETVIMASFGAIGGMLSYLMRTLNKDQKPEVSKFIVEGLSSGFVGLLAMLMCKAMSVDPLWSGVIVGVFGWVGAEASIAILSRVIRQRLGVDNGNNKGS